MIVSIFLFILDLNDYQPGLTDNLRDILLMTGIFFIIGLSGYTVKSTINKLRA
jgi:hypothetical protein